MSLQRLLRVRLMRVGAPMRKMPPLWPLTLRVIALLEERQVTVGGAVVVPKGDFTGTGSGTPGETRNEDGFLNTSFIPFGYFSMPIDEKLSFGMGIYAPFGSNSEYGDDWAGKYLANKTDLSVINIQPTVAYKFSDDFSIGLGVFRFLWGRGTYP